MMASSVHQKLSNPVIAAASTRSPAVSKSPGVHGIGMWRPLRAEKRVVPWSSNKDDFDLVRKEKIDTSTTLFVFGTEEKATSQPQPEDKRNSESRTNSEAKTAPAKATETGPEATQQAAASTSASEIPVAAVESTSDVTTQEPSIPQHVAAEAQDLQQTPTSNGKGYDREYLSSCTVAELRSLCRDNDVKGYSKLRKDELVDLLESLMK